MISIGPDEFVDRRRCGQKIDRLVLNCVAPICKRLHPRPGLIGRAVRTDPPFARASCVNRRRGRINNT
jgi:hypothetical protein